MAQNSPSRKQDQYIVRFPDGMRDRLKDAAAENGRSMNAEIIHRLESTFPPGIPAGEAGRDVRDSIAELRRLLDVLETEVMASDPPSSD